jgi:hypothetical protein
MADKFIDQDAKKEHFSIQMELQKKSNNKCNSCEMIRQISRNVKLIYIYSALKLYFLLHAFPCSFMVKNQEYKQANYLNDEHDLWKLPKKLF